jgi:hypothetical protein
MATKRRPIERALRAQITDELAGLYRHIREIVDSEGRDGPRRLELIELSVALHNGLGLKVWEWPVDCVPLVGPPPSWKKNPDDFIQAQQLRRAIEDRARLQPVPLLDREFDD